MSTAWSSVSRHAWCRKHTSARWRRGGRHLAHSVGRGGSHAVEPDPLIVALDPGHVDFQHAGRLDQFQPRQQPLHATDRRVRRAGLDAVQGRVRLVVVDGDQRIRDGRASAPTGARSCVASAAPGPCFGQPLLRMPVAPPCR